MERELKLIARELPDVVNFKTNRLTRNREEEDSIFQRFNRKGIRRTAKKQVQSIADERSLKSQATSTKGYHKRETIRRGGIGGNAFSELIANES
jgi:hypothetical protein